MTQKTVTFGAPGTGKTTTLINDLHDTLHSYGPNRIAVLTFSRQQAHEIFHRLGVTREEARKDYPYFGPYHSVLYRMLGIRRQEDPLAEPEDYAKFSKTIAHYDYDTAAGTIDAEGYHNPSDCLGNLMFQAFQRAVATSPRDPKKGITQSVVDKHGGYIPVNHLQRLIGEWQDFKAREGIIEYGDILLMGLDSCPYIHAIYVDEFQDTNPIQYGIYKNWARTCERVYIYGDDDQCIYEQMMGSQSQFLLDERKGAKVRVLDHTYRLPSRILHQATKFIEQNRNRQPKTVTAAKDGGVV
jgi:superfamily I DNA/RNA helicase